MDGYRNAPMRPKRAPHPGQDRAALGETVIGAVGAIIAGFAGWYAFFSVLMGV
mgnify:CR=1 FL=1